MYSERGVIFLRGKTMAKRFTYTNIKTGRVIFDSVEPNMASRDIIDKKVAEQTGTDPRLMPHVIDCQIRVVPDNFIIEKPKKNYHHKKIAKRRNA
jgi:hypothetical protein